MPNPDGVLVHHPCHDLGIGADIRGGDVLVGAEKGEDLRYVASGNALEFTRTQQFGVDCDSTLGPTEGKVHERSLEGHRSSQGNGFIAVYRRVVAQAALAWTAGDVVLHAPAGEAHACAVVTSNGNRHFEHPPWGDEILDDTVFELQPLSSLTHAVFHRRERLIS